MPTLQIIVFLRFNRTSLSGTVGLLSLYKMIRQSVTVLDLCPLLPPPFLTAKIGEVTDRPFWPFAPPLNSMLFGIWGRLGGGYSNLTMTSAACSVKWLKPNNLLTIGYGYSPVTSETLINDHLSVR